MQKGIQFVQHNYILQLSCTLYFILVWWNTLYSTYSVHGVCSNN